MSDLRAVDDLGQKRAAMGQAKCVDHVGIIGAVAEIAEGEAGFGRISGTDAGQIQVEPVLAVQRHLGPVQ